MAATGFRCSRCQHQNGPGAKFCEECAAPLKGLACAVCGAAVSPTAKFCAECAHPVGQAAIGARGAAAPATERPPTAPADAERRQLTVMFCDLVGSMALSARLDPEELREVVRAYQSACAEVIARFDGHIAQYLGDGLLVYFGYPKAHEDDAERAVRAGLGIRDGLSMLNEGARGPGRAPLSVRIGIHTGPVVVGDVGAGSRSEQLALGETPNVAARLQGLAEPDTVVISEATHHLVQGLFVSRDLGPHALKGLATPIRVRGILGEGTDRSRLDVAAGTGLTPLVGREQELGLLADRWERAADGHGHVVLLTGEPGIGKSRLLRALKDRVAAQSHAWLECRCSPYHQQSPLHPFIDLLARLFDWNRDDPVDLRLAKLEGRFHDWGLTVAEGAPLLAGILDVPTGDRYSLPLMSPERQRQRALEVVVAVILAHTVASAAVLVVEDLQWIDPSSLELLTLLLDQVAGARLLAVFTARPQFQSPWQPRTFLSSLSLNRLTRRQTEELVTRVAAAKVLPGGLVTQIVAKTDGVPLFIEELTKAVLESDTLSETGDASERGGSLPALSTPATLRDSLTARLDRLEAAKEVAQLGATLGRSFSYALLRAVAPRDEEHLRGELRRLVDAELLYQRGVPPAATYTFKHALIQDAAYDSLLRATRAHYHQRVARALVDHFPGEAETRPEVVAQHFAGAGLTAEAVDWWYRAGTRAMGQSAYGEAVAHFRHALKLLDALLAGRERDERELALQVGLGHALVPILGWTAAEVADAFSRARSLSARAADSSLRFQAVLGLTTFHLTRAEFSAATETADECLAIARQTGDSDFLAQAVGMRSLVGFWRGDFIAGQTYAEQALALYDPDKQGSHAVLFGWDPKVMALYNLAAARWGLGQPDRALASGIEAVAAAKDRSHPFTRALAQNLLARIHQLRRDWDAALAASDELLSCAADLGFPMFTALGEAHRGTALAWLGQPEGIALLKSALTALESMGMVMPLNEFLPLMADWYRRNGAQAEGLNSLNAAFALVEKAGGNWYESEMWRIKGELACASDAADTGEAETCFLKALDIARARQAKSFELRAAMSLSRFWQGRGKRDEGRQLLADGYGWFSEGLETADLTDARAMLENLSR